MKNDWEFEENPECCSYPYGKRLSVVSACVCLIGFVLNVAATRVCDFLERSTDMRVIYDGALIDVSAEHYFGLWAMKGSIDTRAVLLGTYDDDDVCYEYPSEYDKPDEMIVAQAMSIISCILGGFSTFFFMSFACNNWQPTYCRLIAIVLAIAIVAESLTFMFFNIPICDGHYDDTTVQVTSSAVSCEMSTGAIMAAISMFYYLLSIGLVLKIAKVAMEKEAA